MKAIILARVSTEEQREAGNSLPAQVARMERYCEQQNFEVIETFSFDESAYKTKRDEFDKILKKQKVQQFDSLLLAHVLEHLTTEDGIALLRKYTPFIKDKVVVICPQEKGFASDETHINFLKHKDIEQMLKSCGLKKSKTEITFEIKVTFKILRTF